MQWSRRVHLWWKILLLGNMRTFPIVAMWDTSANACSPETQPQELAAQSKSVALASRLQVSKFSLQHYKKQWHNEISIMCTWFPASLDGAREGRAVKCWLLPWQGGCTHQLRQTFNLGTVGPETPPLFKELLVVDGCWRKKSQSS